MRWAARSICLVYFNAWRLLTVGEGWRSLSTPGSTAECNRLKRGQPVPGWRNGFVGCLHGAGRPELGPKHAMFQCNPFHSARLLQMLAGSPQKALPAASGGHNLLIPTFMKAPISPVHCKHNILGSSKVLLTFFGNERACLQLLFTNGPLLFQMSNFLCCNVVSLGQWQCFRQLLVEFCNQRELCPIHRLVNWGRAGNCCRAHTELHP